ncbi:MAG TPA: CHASE2 domain-containing protein [Burkholderiales bacterium]|nr:CHASE2 domain-containing protein [Burkholderiales bacterium]
MPSLRYRLNFALKALLVCFVGLLAATVFAFTTLYDRLDGWVQDSLQRALATSIPLDDIVVFDIDETSLGVLMQALGPWPYDHEAFAFVQRYLNDHGAHVITYDMLLAERREGDQAFAATLRPNVVLTGAGLPVALLADADYQLQLEHAAMGRDARYNLAGIKGKDEAARRPYEEWPYVKLPFAHLTERARVGVNSVTADEDGVVRHLPLFHGSQGFVFPSLPLATLMAAEPEAVEARWDRTRLRVRDESLPLSSDGKALLRFPSNASSLRVVPFYELVRAATQSATLTRLGKEIKGKAVFIGSSSFVGGTQVYTPVGRMSGLQFSALAYAMLDAGSVLTPSNFVCDSSIALLALALPLLLLARGGEASGRGFLLVFFGLPTLCLAMGIALFAFGMQSNWLFAATGGLSAWTGVLAIWLFDISGERRRLRYEAMAARQANRLKSEFLNQLTHELRTPLTAIMGFNKVNQFTEDLGRDQRIHNSAIIGHNCEHLLALINNNLDLAKIEAGTLIIAPAPEDPEQLCRDVINTLQGLAQEKRLRLKFVKSTPLPPALMLDAFRVRQILMNLVGNALKFTQSGSVELSASWHVAALAIEVHDTGTGIPEHALARIFEPYEQADSSVAQRFGGTGLGLAITRELVELMDGSIEVTSQPAMGSVFRVRVPCEVVTQAEGVRSIEEARAMREPLHGRVLLAEDNEDIRLLIELQLRRLGLETVAVSNGLAAVETALAENFDAILMDMEMPLMNGHEAVNVLRTRNYSGTILALTAHHEGVEVERALTSGCDGVIHKPIALESLRSSLRPVLRSSRRVGGRA